MFLRCHQAHTLRRCRARPVSKSTRRRRHPRSHVMATFVWLVLDAVCIWCHARHTHSRTYAAVHPRTCPHPLPIHDDYTNGRENDSSCYKIRLTLALRYLAQAKGYEGGPCSPALRYPCHCFYQVHVSPILTVDIFECACILAFVILWTFRQFQPIFLLWTGRRVLYLGGLALLRCGSHSTAPVFHLEFIQLNQT